ncbi:MAG: hypothetical protein PW734_08065 [Verrucomicrobium sp.]|nr:hypothetical protein [Verrucomicrobium sp.]
MDKSWSKILLVAVLLLLAGEGIWLGLAYSRGEASAASPAAPGQIVAELPADVAEQAKAWNQPVLWALPSGGGHLFTARRLLYFVGTGKVELARPDTKIDGIPLDWLLKNGLDASDPDVAHQDPDGDGFDNLAEFLSGADPRDPKSHPSYAKLLRVKSFEAKPFSMTLASVNDLGGGQRVFQINTPNGRRPTNNVKIGDSFEGYTVADFRPKQGAKKIGDMEVTGDISELELKKEATGEAVVLVYQEPKSEPSISATIVLLLPDAFSHPVKVAQGKEFTIQAGMTPQGAPETLRYRLNSVDASGAKVSPPDSQETLLIPPLTSAESAAMGAPKS